jgi:hypothetical protein
MWSNAVRFTSGNDLPFAHECKMAKTFLCAVGVRL